MSPREEELLQKLALRDEENAQLKQEVALLRAKIDLLVKRIFGASSEKLDPAQLELLLNGGVNSGKDDASSEKEEAGATPFPDVQAGAAAKSRRERTPRLPENLPVVEEIIEPEPVKAAPQAWRYIGEEITEQLDYEPAHFLRRLFIRRKYVERQEKDAVPIIAPLPPTLQERGIAAPGLLAQVLVAKYCDHLPLYRQQSIYQIRHGVYLPRQTLARWVDLSAYWLTPIYNYLHEEVTEGDYVQVDETPVEYLEPGNGKTKKGYFWVCNRPGGAVVFHWKTSRATAALETIIPVNFKGVLQCDAYSVYGSFAGGEGKQIQLSGCYAHVRRKFYEAKEQAPQVAGWLLRQIQHLYQVEAELRSQRAGPRLRQARRAAQSRMVHARIYRCLTRLNDKKRYLPKSPMGAAINYALGQWATLGVYLENDQVEIDNNLVENAIRPTAVGKKNWLFIGDAEAGQRSAIIYTIIENCRRHGVDPYAYLRYVLAALPTLTNWQIKDVTPEAYAKVQRPTPIRAAA